MLIEESIQGFLDEVASDSPAPGGGSVSALAGALGAGLASMVCRLTIGKDKFKDVEEEMKEIVSKMDEAKKRLTMLVDVDADAFSRIMTAYALPKGSDEEKAARKAAIQDATKEATRVPLETSRICKGLLDLMTVVAEKGNPQAASDIGVAALMAKAGFAGAGYNVKINLGSIKDEAFKAQVAEEQAKMESEVEVKTARIAEIVASKI